jgi:hypothetical protein
VPCIGMARDPLRAAARKGVLTSAPRNLLFHNQ